jgi:thiamine pyrophosphate-dependent acetolactate synthase large subunit-like protein
MSAMTVQDVVARLLAERRDQLAVVTMSAMPFWPAGDRDYRLLGLMGGAASIGLGLALGRPDREVWVIDGDGSVLMQLGVLSAIGGARPPNLTHIVIANGVYAVSGAQPIPTAPDWPQLFRAAGYPRATACADAGQLRAALTDGPKPAGIAAICTPERPTYPPNAFSFSAAGEAARLRTALTALTAEAP